MVHDNDGNPEFLSDDEHGGFTEFDPAKTADSSKLVFEAIFYFTEDESIGKDYASNSPHEVNFDVEIIG